MQKLNILGTEYRVVINDDECMESNADGLCKFYEKEIVLRSPENMLEPDCSNETKEIRMKEVKRHEIIHAFFAESGLFDYSDNEQLVQWLAIQFPKMLKTFMEMQCL